MLAAFFRHGSNLALVLLAIALFGAFALRGVVPSILCLGIGALVFFVSEYTTHRFMLHAPPQKNAFILGLQHRLHYDHHVTPNELGLLFLPLWFAVPVTLLTAAIYWTITRDAALTGALLLGSVLGLLYYEWVHYVAHIPFVPRSPFGRYVKKYHLWHHYKNETLWFGVTNPSMDFVGHTYRRVEDVERSPSTRILFPEQ
jgi:4-hydroxysphinganine ceramide fatty acyl 2-hydroxylase